MDYIAESPDFCRPPADDEFELSVFGPGMGECLVVHLGRAEWVVIDSCRYPGTRSPVAIAYLEALGIDPSDAIKRILATHWHDDHIRGLGDLVRRCPKAEFAMSAALGQSQFYQLVFEVEARNKLVAASSSATEFADILDQFAERGTQPPTSVSDGFLLFQGGYQGAVQVRALSPSPATIQDAQSSIAKRIMSDAPIRKFKRLGPNDLSVAVQISAVTRDLLLKADLENTNVSLTGWNAVLNSQFRPNQMSEIVKVAHHGSENADNDTVWTTMVLPKPTSIVTPYSRLANPLPREEDIQRIKSRNGDLFCTTWPPSTKAPRRRGIDGLVASATRTRKSLNRRSGIVRLRYSFANPNDSPRVETFGSATEL
jgi:beta-lactamase superfamily II metal-dependent hydrolase